MTSRPPTAQEGAARGGGGCWPAGSLDLQVVKLIAAIVIRTLRSLQQFSVNGCRGFTPLARLNKTLQLNNRTMRTCFV